MGHRNSVNLLRKGAAIVLSFAACSAFPFANSAQRALAGDKAEASYANAGLATGQDSSQGLNLSAASATSFRDGVLLRWHTDYELNNLGFNIYRVRSGQRLLANRSLIPGSVFAIGEGKPLPGGYAYQWFDKEGTADSVYYIESESLNGNRNSYASAITVSTGKQQDYQQSFEAPGGSAAQSASASQGLTEYPAQLAAPQSTTGQIDTQWTVAAQSALKIQINHDGWYRVTQQQMSAAGFNPLVDVRNLSVFADGRELAIRTSKDMGQLTTGDYLEFYGRGLDTPDSNSKTYYLIAGTQPGKRAATAPQSVASQLPAVNQARIPPAVDLSYRGWFAPLVNLATGQAVTSTRNAGTRSAVTSIDSSASNKADRPVVLPNSAPILGRAEPSTREDASQQPQKNTSNAAKTITISPVRGTTSPPVEKRRTVAKTRRKSRQRRARRLKPHHSHAAYETTASSVSFDYTIQLKERYTNPATGFAPVYFTRALNGEGENWFGRVISSLPAVQTIPVRNVESTADGPARLVVALQGIQSSNPSHQVNVFFNGLMIGSMSFFGIDHAVQTFNIPVSQLLEGDNTVRLAQASSNDTSIVDYLTLTYPHSYKAFNDSLRFTLRSAQTLQIDGFSTPNVQLLDISDLTAVRVTQTLAAASALGYAITVPRAGGKVREPLLGAPELQVPRTLYALPDGQFETPAGFSLNQASTLNLPSNTADLVILSYKDFLPSLAPLVAKRQSEGLTVKVVDIEDVYDEFSYGAHDHHAIKDFLVRASGSWTKAPRYVLLLGDASYDPRNYEVLVGSGGGLLPSGGDFVPTNLVDTLFGEACSDDVLADFNGDGIAEIPVGRLPAASVAEATLMVSKIANFVKANVPQSAILVADSQRDCGGNIYYFNFSQANGEIKNLVQPTLTAQSLDRGENWTPTTDANLRANIISSINQGVALVNYSGHGNVNVWSCGSLLTATDAKGLSNGLTKLPLVVVANCLNGYFNAPTLESLAESFLRAPGGGAVAAYASSGETIPDGQQQMNIKLYQTLFGPQSVALGDVTKQAKTATTDMDVRRTWILLGDPSMKIW